MTRESLPNQLRISERHNWILPTGWVGVSVMRPAETEVMVSPLCLVSGITLNCQTLCLGTRSRHSLNVDEDVKKPTYQTNQLGLYHNYDKSLCHLNVKKEILYGYTQWKITKKMNKGDKTVHQNLLELSQKLNSGQNSERKT